MKKLISAVLLLSILVCLSACGGSETPVRDDTAAAAPAEIPGEQASFDLSGCWTCDGLLHGEEYLGTDEIASGFGMSAGNVMSLELLEDLAVLTRLDTGMRCAYERRDDSLILTAGGEDGFTLTLRAEEDGRLSLDDGELGTVYLRRVEERPEPLSRQLHCYFLPGYTDEESTALANFMARGQYAADGDTFFGVLSERSSHRFGLCSFSLSADEGGAPFVSGAKLLSAQSAPQYVNLHGSDIYFLYREAGDEGGRSVCRIGKDGSGLVTIADDAYGYVQLVGDRLFYCDSSHKYRSVGLDGSGEVLVFDREIYMAYQVKPGLLMYQDDADGESLHLRDLETGADMRIAAGRVYDYGIIGNYLYFAKIDEAADNGWDDICRIYRMDLTRPRPEYADNGELLFAYEYERSESLIGPSLYAFPDMLYSLNCVQAAPDEWETLSCAGDYFLRTSVLYRDANWFIYSDLDSGDNSYVSMINFCSVGSGRASPYLYVEDVM